jgi:predicted short-subunit dehydrogenase-like oxidoreductase (DUF2520 family)
MGSALTSAMRSAGFDVIGPLGRNTDVGDASLVILCVPDSQIRAAATLCPTNVILAHCSGATTLLPLAPHEAFSLHPLLTVTKDTTSFAGAGCAVNATSPHAKSLCLALASALGMRPFEISDDMRPLYHAAASAASNYVVAVASYAEQLADIAGVNREMLAPLVLAAANNWARTGREALTGPVARGDEATVALQRSAITTHAVESLPLWDALVDATRTIARETTLNKVHASPHEETL